MDDLELDIDLAELSPPDLPSKGKSVLDETVWVLPSANKPAPSHISVDNKKPVASVASQSSTLDDSVWVLPSKESEDKAGSLKSSRVDKSKSLLKENNSMSNSNSVSLKGHGDEMAKKNLQKEVVLTENEMIIPLFSSLKECRHKLVLNSAAVQNFADKCRKEWILSAEKKFKGIGFAVYKPFMEKCDSAIRDLEEDGIELKDSIEFVMRHISDVDSRGGTKEILQSSSLRAKYAALFESLIDDFSKELQEVFNFEVETQEQSDDVVFQTDNLQNSDSAADQNAEQDIALISRRNINSEHAYQSSDKNAHLLQSPHKDADKETDSTEQEFEHLVEAMETSKDQESARISCRSLEYFAKKKKHADSFYYLGKLFEAGMRREENVLVEPNHPKAIQMYEHASQLGNVASLNSLGRLFLKGTGVELSPEKAFSFFEKSHQLGNTDGTIHLAGCYEYGSGVQNDLSRALELYNLASENGHHRAAIKAGKILGKNPSIFLKSPAKFFKIVSAAADAGHSSCFALLGLCYQNGSGAEKDLHRALEWYKKGVHLEDPLSLNYMGVLYQKGIGVSKDFSRAAQYFKRAAEKSCPEGLANLAWCFQSGEGVEKDGITAVKCYRKAAAAGHTESMNILGKINLRRFRESPQDLTSAAEAFKYFNSAALEGDARGMMYLSYCYENGLGASLPDPTLARKWLLKSAEFGCPEAANLYKEKYEKLQRF